MLSLYTRPANNNHDTRDCPAMTMELMKYRLRARRHRIIVLQRLPRHSAPLIGLCGGYVKSPPYVFQAGYMRAFLPLSAGERFSLLSWKKRGERESACSNAARIIEEAISKTSRIHFWSENELDTSVGYAVYVFLEDRHIFSSQNQL